MVNKRKSKKKNKKRGLARTQAPKILESKTIIWEVCSAFPAPRSEQKVISFKKETPFTQPHECRHMADNDRSHFTDLSGSNIETDQTCTDFSPKMK
ncbi:hypothetical protein BZG72_00915 [Salinivibrio sp. PR6]|uniref:Uncharacterized protein n=1 Tax=Salinivibrio siamensis TaxID=414286 RepID=A0ABX3KBY0_9GAMM|nr:hypothetical protein WN56_10255 [Salinivibrio sp. KP-1]MPS32909.1 hypothetical protein [Salinivibrio sp. VYel7]OOE75023.1 hypothetical protein BZG23_07540 [Salinivibrio sp. ML290]OOE80111.1 hypothetical protein BZG25_07010 [Salinivibrio sp. ML198]OOE85242.1 hypothetical protein BZG72_00915 [Salinivibrio sp. PR6]OOE86408.1 hypothetical protein BZG73_05610 [Salinivibrio siamensis]